MLLHKGTPMFVDRLVRVNWRDGASDLEEMAANAFAAELLMPRAFVHEEIEKMVSRRYGLASGLSLRVDAPALRMARAGYRIEG
jgi:Zn-dependent peptidase ImmA (M78 family)